MAHHLLYMKYVFFLWAKASLGRRTQEWVGCLFISAVSCLLRNLYLIYGGSSLDLGSCLRCGDPQLRSPMANLRLLLSTPSRDL